MGELINLNALIQPSQIDPAMATDTEVAAAINTHVAAADPHSGYEFRAKIASKYLTGPLSYPANTWSSLGTFPTFNAGVQGSPSAVLVAISFCFDSSYPWQQACCAALLGPVWWQPATTADIGARVQVEVHNASGFFINIRFDRFSQDLRELLINPESLITIPSAGRVDAILKKLI